jgi:tetratricopeptide (TPR) repeat protein
MTLKLLLRKESLSRMHRLIISALLGGFISMLVSNFFGFSVVMGNLYLFLIPAFVFLLSDDLTPFLSIFPQKHRTNTTHSKHTDENVGPFQWSGIIAVIVIVLFELYLLTTFWMADTSYALANNLDRVGQYAQAYQEIKNAVNLRGDEPVFKEEAANNYAAMAITLLTQKQTDAAVARAQEAMQLIDQLVTEYPNNINFLKSQVRVYYTLSQANPAYLTKALEAMIKAHQLAPTDAKIAYNLGVLYGQTGQTQKGIEILQQTIQLKPDYQEAYYALGLFYRDAAVDKNGRIIRPELEQKAVEQMHYIIKTFPNSKQASDALKSWNEQ